MKIIAPNKQYNGISAGVQFKDGVGECTDPHLIEWFAKKGYVVEQIEQVEQKVKSVQQPESTAPLTTEPEPEGEAPGFEKMTVEELTVYAGKHGIDLGKSTSYNGILKKILENQK
jgi:hypothetical protein